MSTQIGMNPQAAAYTTHSGHGSIGPLIAVLAVITVLGVIAGMIGRLCSGRTIMGRGLPHDFETWVETKCASCIDGRLDPPAPTQTVDISGRDLRHSGPVVVPVEASPQVHHQEKHEDESGHGNGHARPGSSES